MATSIGKLSKSFFVKLLVGIIILPFVFWGMGDVFRGGNQNVIATIDSKKLNTQDFVNYLNKLNLDKEQVKNLKNSSLLENILAEYIGQQVMSFEIEEYKVTINDKSLSNIIRNDKLFFKDNKFSRTEYEKFLLTSGVTAPSFEKNIVKQESKRQFLSLISGGLVIPDDLVVRAFNKENQTKTIKYINLKEFYSKKKATKEEIEKVYNENKKAFIKEFKSLKFAEINPLTLTGGKDYDENFFKKLDDLENKILDGQSFNEAIQQNSLKSISINNIDKNQRDKEDKIVKKISENLFKKVFVIKNEKSPEVFKVDGKYYLAEVNSIEKKDLPISDANVLKLINSQIDFINKIEANKSIAKDISLGGFNKEKLEEFANKHNLIINDYKISDLNQNEIFTEGIIKRIFLTKNGQVDLITNNTLTKNFLVLALKTDYEKIKKNSNQYEQYQAKAKLNLMNKIYKTFDEVLNQKYKVELNNRTIDRVKNSF